MKLVREHIDEKFTEDSDPIRDMGIGLKKKITDWLNTHSDYILDPAINDDCTIDATSLNFISISDLQIPNYIKFNKIVKNISFHDCNLTHTTFLPKNLFGNLFLGNNKLTSLENCPKGEIKDLMLFSNNLNTLKGLPKIVYGNFNCSHNKKLSSLDHMPLQIAGDFACFDTAMSDEYVKNYIIENNIIINGRKIINMKLAKEEKYIL